MFTYSSGPFHLWFRSAQIGGLEEDAVAHEGRRVLGPAHHHRRHHAGVIFAAHRRRWCPSAVCMETPGAPADQVRHLVLSVTGDQLGDDVDYS